MVKKVKCLTPGCDGSGNTISKRTTHRGVKNCPKAHSMHNEAHCSSSAVSNLEIDDIPETTEIGSEIEKTLLTNDNRPENKQLISSFNNSLFSLNDSVLKYFEQVIN